jgi:hypothetical protein
VRGRAAAGKNGAGSSGLHWDEETGRRRLAEVMGWIQGPPRGAGEGLGATLDSISQQPQSSRNNQGASESSLALDFRGWHALWAPWHSRRDIKH